MGPCDQVYLDFQISKNLIKNETYIDKNLASTKAIQHVYDYSFELNSIEIYAPQFFGHNNLLLGSVACVPCKIQVQNSVYRHWFKIAPPDRPRPGRPHPARQSHNWALPLKLNNFYLLILRSSENVSQFSLLDSPPPKF